jgi:hypothetical protein
MRIPDVEVLSAPSVRKSLTTPGDIRSEIDFQNDINNLIARIEGVHVPWKAVSRLMSYSAAPRRVAQRRRNTVTQPLGFFDTPSVTPVAQANEIDEAATAVARIRRGA